jgi:type IV pilus assembly protein PilM
MDTGILKRLFNPKKFEFFAKKEESAVGVDIGTSSVKVVQLKRKEERAILETYGELSVSSYADVAVGQSAHLVESKVSEMLKDLIKEAGVKAKKAAVSIPLRNSFVTVIELPLSADKGLEEAITFEARKYIPVPMSEVVFDWWVLPEDFEDEGLKSSPDSEVKPKPGAKLSNKTSTQVLLAAIHKDVIEKYKKVISQADLEPILFEIEIFSIVRSVFGNQIAPVLVVDIGASTTKMMVVDHGIARFAYSLDRGSQDLSMALSRSLDISFSRAEEIKREIGLSPRPEYKDQVAVLEPILDYILVEVKRVMSDYRRKKNRSVSRIILTGGGSLLKGLVDFTVNRAGIEVILADPFSKVEYPSFLTPVLKEAGPTFSSSLGLALRQLK